MINSKKESPAVGMSWQIFSKYAEGKYLGSNGYHHHAKYVNLDDNSLNDDDLNENPKSESWSV